MALYRDILEIAEVTIDTLNEIGVEDCCFIGGMACKLYTRGRGRKPMDLDILCLTPYPGGAEAIKRDLCQANNNFYTVRARNRNDPWKVLWWDNDGDRPGFEKFKIDILVPGDLDLPEIHPDYIINISGLPCAPLHLLIFHKLKGWGDRHYSPRQDQRAKIPGDRRDIVDLLRIANQQGLKLSKARSYITDSFREDSYERVEEFNSENPTHAWLWEALGL